MIKRRRKRGEKREKEERWGEEERGEGREKGREWDWDMIDGKYIRSNRDKDSWEKKRDEKTKERKGEGIEEIEKNS